MAYPKTANQPAVSEAVRQLRSTLGLTQQAFAVTLDTALTTIARWETVRSPRGSTLKVLAELSANTGRADLAEIFRKELLAEVRLALWSQFRYAVCHQPQAASGAAALQGVVKEALQSCAVLAQPNLRREDAIRAGKDIEHRLQELEALNPTELDVGSRQSIANQEDVSEAVRQLRLLLGLTQQAFAVTLGTAVTTIARWETVRSPRGSTLNVLADLAANSGQPGLARIFRKELLRELGLALRSHFGYAVRHQRQATSGAETLRSVLGELRRSTTAFNQTDLTRDEAIRAGKDIQQQLLELEGLLAAAEFGGVGSKPNRPQQTEGLKGMKRRMK